MKFITALVTNVILCFSSISNAKAEPSSHVFKCEKGTYVKSVPMIERCDFQRNCRDGSDEKNCTRHPGVRRNHPFNIVDQWTQDKIWSRNGSSRPLRTHYDVGYRTQYAVVVTCKRVLNGSSSIESMPEYHYQREYDLCNTRLSDSYKLSSEQENEMVWSKSTAGHMPMGAVLAGLASNFELTFLCRIPQVYIFRYGSTKDEPKPSVGTVRPSTGICYLKTTTLRDYEVLIRAENAAVFNCEANAFHCTDEKQCIHSAFVCDGEADCKDGSDESILMCRKKGQCREDEFPCSDGKCIPMEKVCEATYDWYERNMNCLDGMDESKETFEQFEHCKNQKFRCDDGSFVNITDRCNTNENCRDASDENNCTRHPSLRPALPYQVETQNWKQGLWMDFNKRFQMYFQVASVTKVNPSAKKDHRLETRYFRRAQHKYGNFNLQCFDDNNICNNLLHENGTIVKAKDTDFETLQHALQEHNYEWIKTAMGHIPEGAVVLGMTTGYEPVFICRRTLVPTNSVYQLHTGTGILIPSTSNCRSVTAFEYENNTRSSYHYYKRSSKPFLDYEILRDSGYLSENRFQGSCKDAMFTCGDRQCLEQHFVCDGEWDCANGEDEDMDICRERNKCSNQQFPCSDGKCISRNWTCEGSEFDFKNCFDGNDESHLTCFNNECRESEIRCKGGGCISEADVCNGIWDCKDGDDERNCAKHNCGPKGFRCKSGQCLNATERCDNYYQCADMSDEKACGKHICKAGRNSACRSDPHKLEDNLIRGFWIPSDIIMDRYAALNEDIFDDYSVCRLLDTTNGSSRAVLGALRYESNGGRVVCVSDEFLGLIPTENLPYEILVEDSSAAYKWWESEFICCMSLITYFENQFRNFPNQVIIGGLTDEYEIFLICRQSRIPKFVGGTKRYRLGTCNADKVLMSHKTLLDTRYKN